MTLRPVTATPARGTRPRNRRELIVGAASELFYRRGYPHVSMGDIADAVAVAPSALYRHFTGKQQLLAAALGEAFEEVQRSFDGAAGENPGEFIAALAETAIAHRELGVLWARELRHVEDPVVRAALREKIRTLSSAVRSSVHLLRPDLESAQAELLGWTVMSCLVSPSFHQARLTEVQLQAVLVEIVDSVLASPLPTGRGAAVQPTLAPLRAQNRREQLLEAAIRLFAERGFQAVGIEEIGMTAGIDGTGIYRHFATKADILIAAMNRGAEWLQIDLSRTLASTYEPELALRALLGSYARFVLENVELMEVLFSETAHLPDADRRRSLAAQRDYIYEWVHLVELARPADEAGVARVRVHAALTVVNMAGRTPHLRGRADIAAGLVAVGSAALGVSD